MMDCACATMCSSPSSAISTAPPPAVCASYLRMFSTLPVMPLNMRPTKPDNPRSSGSGSVLAAPASRLWMRTHDGGMPSATSSSLTRSASAREAYVPISRLVMHVSLVDSMPQGHAACTVGLAEKVDVPPAVLQALPYTGTTAPEVTQFSGEARNRIVRAISSALGHCSCLA